MGTTISKRKKIISRFTAIILASTTLIAAFGITQSATADTYTAADDFVAGALDTTKVPGLNVTKYLSIQQGSAPTGSAANPATGQQVAIGVTFRATEILLNKGFGWSDVTPANANNAWTASTTNIRYGKTDGNGEILDTRNVATTAWYSDTTMSTRATFPAGDHYYILEETDSPYAPTFEMASPSIFGLPFRATQTDASGATTDGYVYNLSVFPKNINNGQLSKTSNATNGATIAQVGDVISYKVSQRIYNDKTSAVAGDGKLDLSEITADKAPGTVQLRVADRLSAALALQGSPVVQLFWTDSSGPNAAVLNAGTDYVFSTATTDPGRVNANHAGEPLFVQGASGKGTQYAVFDFFVDPTSFKAQLDANSSDIVIQIFYNAQVTAKGDSTSAQIGELSNSAASDNTDNNTTSTPEITSETTSAGFQFAKTDESSSKPLAGATFRLADPSNSSSFLASDGNFYADSALPTGESFMEATSDDKGIVTFVGLPVLDKVDAKDPTTWVGKASTWDVIEYAAPKGYDRPTSAFSNIVFNSIAGKSAEQISATNPTGLLPDNYPTTLDFGSYSADVTAMSTNFIDANGNVITKGMKEFKSDSPNKPIGLPLTGGAGIVLFLVLGAAIMAVSLVIRRRQKASRQSAV